MRLAAAEMLMKLHVMCPNTLEEIDRTGDLSDEAKRALLECIGA